MKKNNLKKSKITQVITKKGTRTKLPVEHGLQDWAGHEQEQELGSQTILLAIHSRLASIFVHKHLNKICFKKLFTKLKT